MNSERPVYENSIPLPSSRKRERLGEYFVRKGIIAEEDLQRALRLSRSDNISIGLAFIRLGFAQESDIAKALGDMSDTPVLDASALEPAREALQKVPEHLARQHRVLPLFLDNRYLVAAVDRPLSRPILRSIERMTRMPISLRIAASTPLQNSLALAFTKDTVAESTGRSATDIVDDIIITAVKVKASDIHLEPLEERVRLRFRIDGVLKEMDSYSSSQYVTVISRIKVMAGLNIAERRAPQDGAVQFSQNGVEIDLRVSVLPSIHGEKIVMRLLAGKGQQLTIDMIGLSPSVYSSFNRLVNRPYGIVMIVGPTGSGKSTTLSAALNTINNPDINIVTVEDPVEYKLEGITQVHVGQNDRLTFAGALRAILRQDPDVIMVGETRDSETAEISLRAALTGHMVFTTLHTNDAPGALPRLVDMGCEPFLVSSSVSAVLAQRLLRRLCQHCCEPYPPTEEQCIVLGVEAKEQKQWYRPVGCPACNGIGYRGRTGIFELLEVTPAIQRAIMAGESGDKLMEIATAGGMKTLRQDALEKLDSGITSAEEVVRVTVA